MIEDLFRTVFIVCIALLIGCFMFEPKRPKEQKVEKKEENNYTKLELEEGKRLPWRWEEEYE